MNRYLLSVFLSNINEYLIIFIYLLGVLNFNLRYNAKWCQHQDKHDGPVWKYSSRRTITTLPSIHLLWLKMLCFGRYPSRTSRSLNMIFLTQVDGFIADTSPNTWTSYKRRSGTGWCSLLTWFCCGRGWTFGFVPFPRQWLWPFFVVFICIWKFWTTLLYTTTASINVNILFCLSRLYLCLFTKSL